jgi:hypothetical protein
VLALVINKQEIEMEIKQGTYISTIGLTEEKEQKAVKAMIDAGAIRECESRMPAYTVLLWDQRDDTAYFCDRYIAEEYGLTEITYVELVGEDTRHPQYDLIEKYYREWGEWDAYFKPNDRRGWYHAKRPNWDGDWEWELRPRKKMMKIGDYEFPEPEREAPEVGTTYYIVDKTAEKLTMKLEWEGDPTDMCWLKRGLIHLSESAAFAHAKAEIKAAGGEVDE